MKVLKVKTQPAEPAKEKPWAESRQTFVALKPLNLATLPDNVMVCDIAHRPYLSKLAKEQGITYTTISLGDDKMMVLCYTFARKEKLKKAA